jgi:hypothetical protein
MSPYCNLSRSFSLRSCKSVVVWLSRSFAVSVSPAGTTLSRVLADDVVSQQISS